MKKIVLAALCVFSLQGMESEKLKLSDDPVREQALEFVKRAKEIAKAKEERARLLQESKALQQVGPLAVTILNGTRERIWIKLEGKDGETRCCNINAWKSVRISEPELSLNDRFTLSIFDRKPHVQD